MDGYCVIQFRNKGEKTKVLGLLVETESKFIVTTDLKEYVTEKYKVKIIDCIDMKDQSTNTIEDIERIKKETVDEVVIVEPTTINNIVEQPPPPPPSPSNDVQPSPIVSTQKKQVKKEVVVVPEVVVMPSESITIDQTPFENDNQFRELEAAVIKDEPRDQVVFVDVAPAIDNDTDILPIGQQFEVGVDPVMDYQFGDVGAYEPVAERQVVETSFLDFQPTPSLETSAVKNSGMEVEDQSQTGQKNVIGTTTIKAEAVNNMTNVAPIVEPPTIDNNLDTEIPDIQPSNDNDSPSVAARVYRQPSVPYSKRSATPRKEVMVRRTVGMEPELGTGGNTFEMDEDKDGVNLNINCDIPEDVQSTSKRSGRVTKRPKVSTDEESDIELKCAPVVKAQRKYTPRPEKSEACQKCGALQKGYVQKFDHVMVHAKMIKYECMVEGCGYKAADRRYIGSHMKAWHEKKPNNYRQIQITREQTDELNEMMKECFSDKNVKNENSCQICHQTIGWNGFISAFYQREHALHHLDFMLYKCMEKGCQFESKSERGMKCHRRCHGDGASRVMSKVELTKEQEAEIVEMVLKCFPAINTNRDEESRSV